jgi:hypothetical protein
MIFQISGRGRKFVQTTQLGGWTKIKRKSKEKQKQKYNKILNNEWEWDLHLALRYSL